METQTENILKIIQGNATEKELDWLNQTITPLKNRSMAFVATPRFIGKRKITVEGLNEYLSPIETWTLDRLVRVYILLCLEDTSAQTFKASIETLFDTAEINEGIALYSALPFFKEPQLWLYRATEAVRSNIGGVFDAIAFNNAYPALYFPILAWNQLVLKCIFNDKPIHLIQGLDNRANQALADTLSDFAHERWAAGRTVPAQVWRLVTNFVNDAILNDLEHLFLTGNTENKIAATLVCTHSGHTDVSILLQKYPLSGTETLLIATGWRYLEGLQ
jgi:hypothetical protein